MMSSMKRPDAANDNDAVEQIARCRAIWEPRLGRRLTDEDARQFQRNIAGFFDLLLEWARAEHREPANDNDPSSVTNDGGERHDR